MNSHDRLEGVQGSLPTYYRDAQDWGETHSAQQRLRSDRLFLLSLVLALIALASVIAVAVLLPLKERVPYAIEVNSVTGAISDATPLSTYSPSQLVAEHFLAQYIEQRVGFHRAFQSQWFTDVQLMSAPAVRQAYVDEMKHDKNSPLTRLKTGETITVYINDIELTSDKQATVRYQTTLHDSNGGKTVAHWSATLSFYFGRVAEDDEHRYRNRLGFTVDHFVKHRVRVKGD